MDTAKSTAGGISQLRALADIILSSIDKIEAGLDSSGQTYPSADEPFNMEEELTRMSPDIAEPGSILVAAAGQLIAAVRLPPLSMLIHATQVNHFLTLLSLIK